MRLNARALFAEFALISCLSASFLACPGPRPTATCEGVVCINGRCVEDQGVAACVCDEGYVKQAGACLTAPPPPPTGACVNNPCAATGRSKCTDVGGLPVCSCADWQVELGGTCVTKTACTPNPCTLPHQATCQVVAGAATCLCAEGYAPEAGGCSATPVFDCAAQHSGGAGEDPFEPDECPSQASTLDQGVTQSRSLAPTGDVDWVAIYGERNHVVRVSLAGSVALYVDLFDSTGLKAVAADHRGSTSAEVRFAAPTSSTWYVRAKALRTNDTGAYTITVEDLGADDYTGVLNEALELPAASTFAGAVQFPGDEDVVKVTLPALHTVEFSLATGATASVDVLAQDGTSEATLATGGLAKYRVFSAQPSFVYLRGKGATPTALGTFSVTGADLGVDDHGDVAARATALTATGLLTNASFNRAGDIDAFSFDAQAGDIYNFTCNPVGTGAYGCNVVLRDAAGTVLAQDTGSGSNFIAWKATSAQRLTVFVTEYYGYAGSYSFRLEDLGVDDYGDTAAQATALTPGVARSGRIETLTDADAFSFSATANHVYRVVCTAGAALGSCLTTLTSPSGATVSGAQVLAVTGQYSLVVKGNGSTAGTYTVTVFDDGGDDFGNTAASATTLTLGTATAGNVQYAGDVDFFAFTATTNHVYQVSCATTASYVCTLAVRDASGTSLASSSYGTVSLPFHVVTAGAITVQVSGYSSSYTGAYTLTVTDLGADDHADTSVGATSLTAGTPTAGSIQFQYDKDVFSFATVANHIYQVQCSSSASYVCVLALSDLGGVSLASSSYGTTTTAAFRATSTSTAFAQVAGYSTYLGAYTLTLTDAGVDDHADTAVGATPLAAGASLSGNIQFAYDKDVFSFTTVANHAYRFNCGSGTTYVCALVVRDAAGTLVTSATSGSATTTSFLAPSAGTWTVEVSGYSSYLGAYTLALVDVGVDDHGNTAATATPITVGGAAVAGNVQFGGDKDVFSFAATAGRIYRFSCATSVSYLCVLAVKDPSGVTAAASSYSTSASASFIATMAGTWTVEVSAWSTSYTGAYAVQLADLGSDDHGNTAATATALTVNTLVAGSIEVSGDVDVFSFSAVTAHFYRVTCTSSTWDACALTVRDAAATSVASTSSSTLATATIKATTAGIFTIEARAYFTATGTYQLKYEDLGADDVGDTLQTATALTLGTARTGVNEVVTDVDFFAVTLAASSAHTVTVTAGYTTWLTAYNAAGTVVGSSSSTGTLSLPATTAGTYYVRVMPYSTGSGAYTITVQ
jgi:hypothetical protein